MFLYGVKCSFNTFSSGISWQCCTKCNTQILQYRGQLDCLFCFSFFTESVSFQLVSGFDVYECFDLAVCNANAEKAQMSKVRTIFHALHEKNIANHGIKTLAHCLYKYTLVCQIFHTPFSERI